jgi:hypothetical protein
MSKIRSLVDLLVREADGCIDTMQTLKDELRQTAWHITEIVRYLDEVSDGLWSSWPPCTEATTAYQAGLLKRAEKALSKIVNRADSRFHYKAITRCASGRGGHSYWSYGSYWTTRSAAVAAGYNGCCECGHVVDDLAADMAAGKTLTTEEVVERSRQWWEGDEVAAKAIRLQG